MKKFLLGIIALLFLCSGYSQDIIKNQYKKGQKNLSYTSNSILIHTTTFYFPSIYTFSAFFIYIY